MSLQPVVQTLFETKFVVAIRLDRCSNEQTIVLVLKPVQRWRWRYISLLGTSTSTVALDFLNCDHHIKSCTKMFHSTQLHHLLAKHGWYHWSIEDWVLQVPVIIILKAWHQHMYGGTVLSRCFDHPTNWARCSRVGNVLSLLPLSMSEAHRYRCCYGMEAQQHQ